MPGVAREPALRRVFQLAAQLDLHPQRPDGHINLFSNLGAGRRTVSDLDAALTALAGGAEHGQFWTNDNVDVYLNWEGPRLVWALDSVFCSRTPTPEADSFRDLHRRLTELWTEVAQQLNADCGRVLDEWSTEQIWRRGVHDAVHPANGWPAELGWWTYLSPGQPRPPAPLTEIEAHTRRLPNEAWLVTLLHDPAAVDPLRYEKLHQRWLQS